jgi:DNA-directed RNA polymerase specialized sigma24 family protein
MHFPTTHWSLLAKATLDGEPESRAALEELCGRYWRPLKEFIQARGHNPTEAEDLTQAFLVHLLEHSTFRRADAARGRFRSFLLGALARYLGDQRDKRGAQKRGGQVAHTSLDDENTLEPAAVIRAEETFHFDRAWAVAVLRASLARARAEYANSGREEVFVTLRSFMPGAGQAPSYEQAAAQCGLSVAAFTSELHRLRRRVREFARDEVMQTVAAPHEVDGELDHLRRVLMDRGTQFPTGDES